jgi:O-antigen/teichoic acid export membrane protein
MGLVFVPVYIYYLGVEAYGLIGIFSMMQIWLTLLDMGMMPALSREMACVAGDSTKAQSIRNLLRTIEIFAFGIAIFMALNIWMASGWLASRWLRVERLPISTVVNALGIMGIVAGLRFVENIYTSSLIGLQRQVILNVMTGLMGTIRSVGAVGILIWVSPTLEAFFWWQGFISIIMVGLYVYIVYILLPASPMPGRFSLNALSGIRHFAAGTLTLTFLGFMLSQTDKLILSKFLSLEDFGFYTLAFTMASSVRLLAKPVDQSVYPRLIALYQEQSESALTEAYHKANQLTVVLLGSCGILLAFFGEKILNLWTRNQILSQHTYQIMWILTIGMVANGVLNGPVYLQMASGKTGILVKVNLAMVPLFVPLVYVLTRNYGAIGAGIAWICLNIAYLVIMPTLIHKQLLPAALKDWYIKDLLLPMASALSVGILLKVSLPNESSSAMQIVSLATSLFLILAAAALGADQIRKYLIKRIFKVAG